MLMASKGHFFTQMPQPMQSSSEMKAICVVCFPGAMSCMYVDESRPTCVCVVGKQGVRKRKFTLEVGMTSMQSFPCRTTGQLRLHS